MAVDLVAAAAAMTTHVVVAVVTAASLAVATAAAGMVPAAAHAAADVQQQMDTVVSAAVLPRPVAKSAVVVLDAVSADGCAVLAVVAWVEMVMASAEEETRTAQFLTLLQWALTA